MGVMKLTSHKKGVVSESLAAMYLMGKGYKILETRYKCRYGEIDMLAMKKDVLVAVEVKYRQTNSDAHGHISETITPKAQGRIQNALLHYISEHPAYADYGLRFDVILITKPFQIEHLDNAWEATT